jgi:hypothetical protein
MTGDLIPISDEQAKAMQEMAKLASKIVDASSGIGRYVDRVLGHVPDNLVGYFGGDYLAEVRTRNAERLRADTEEIRRRRGTQERVDVSPSIAIPLVQAAIDEDRADLKDLWARLLAAAMDPARTHLVRLAFIDVAKKMDPMDAAVLRLASAPGEVAGSRLSEIGARLGASRNEIDVSIANLVKLELARYSHAPNALITPFGQEFLRAVED